MARRRTVNLTAKDAENADDFDHRRFCLRETEGMFSFEPWEVELDDVRFNELEVVHWNNWRFVVGVESAVLEERPGHRFNRGPLVFQSGRSSILQTTDWFLFEQGILFVALRSAIEDCWLNGQWERHFFFNENCALRQVGETACFELTLCCDGVGFWSDHSGPIHDFVWSKAGQQDFLFRASATDVLKRLAQEPAASRWAYVRRFATLPPEHQHILWVQQLTHSAEVCRLLRLALLSQEEVWRQAEDLSLRVKFNWDEERDGDVEFEFTSSSLKTPWQIEGLEEAVEAAIYGFQPELSPQIIDGIFEAEQKLENEIWDIQIEVQNPTAHERIEAALKWREWLAEHELSA